jgi:hypothetical protein
MFSIGLEECLETMMLAIAPREVVVSGSFLRLVFLSFVQVESSISGFCHPWRGVLTILGFLEAEDAS